MDLERLLQHGKELGISSPDLRSWIDKEQARERDQRTADRAAAKEAEEISRAYLKEEKQFLSFS